MQKNKYIIYAITLLAVCTLLFTFLNMQIPKVIDDYPYSRSFVGVSNMDEDQDMNGVISSFGDLWDSQVSHYSAINGRFPVHFIVQYFCCIAGKIPFNIIQGLFFLLWILLASRITKLASTKEFLPKGAIALLLMLVFFSDPSSFYNGIAYSINYLWVPLLFLAFFCMFDMKGKASWAIYPLVFACGFSNEGFTLPLTAALFIMLVLNRKEASRQAWIIVALMIIGNIILVAAPSNFNRLASVKDTVDATSPVVFHLMGLKAFRIVYIWFILAFGYICLALVRTRQIPLNEITRYCKENQLYLLMIVFSFLMSLAIGGDNLRQGVMGEMSAALLIAKMLPDSQKLTLATLLALAVMLLGINMLQRPYTKQFHEVEQMIAQSPDDSCIIRKELVPHMPPQVGKYASSTLNDFQIYQFKWWYQKDTVIIIDTRKNN